MGLISKTAMVGLMGKNEKYYEALGYEIPRRKNKWGKLTHPKGTKIEVRVEDLKPNSGAIVEYECDGCKGKFTTEYAQYVRFNHDGKYYCRECGVEIFNTGENCYCWDNNKTQEERENKRHYPEYKEFIKKVLNRDDFTCCCCGKSADKMEVHHLDGYDWCKERRVDETNGVTLCESCHKNFHSKYGYGENTKEQFEEWIGYTFNELGKYNGNLPTAKKVYCLEEDKVYNSANEFAKAVGVDRRKVYTCCNHNGRSISVKGFHILWVNEYENMSLQEKEEWIKKCTTKHEKRVICLNTKEIFESIIKAQEKYENAKSICNNCKGRTKSSGVLNNKKLVWKFYEDYLNMSQEEIDDCIKEANKVGSHGSKRVICITTGKVFNSASEGGRHYGLNTPTSICDVCKGRRGSVLSKDGVKLSWKYIEDLTEEELEKYDVKNKVKKFYKEDDK